MRFREDRCRRRARGGAGGFMLLEVVIAVGVFAFAVVGLAGAMNRLIDVELLSREEQRLRLEVESRLAEARLERVVEGTLDLGEDAAGIQYTRIVEPVELENADGVMLDGLFLLRVEGRRGDEVVQFSEVIVNANKPF